jgi:hypothetical protein
MAPRLQTALTTLLFLAGNSIAQTDDTWTIQFSNTTASTGLCGLNPETVVFTSNEVNTCTVLDNTFQEWKPISVGLDLSIRENCIQFHAGGNCDGQVLAQTDVINTIVDPGHCEEGSGPFNAVFYKGECVTGGGG